jgi:hypothetical protein
MIDIFSFSNLSLELKRLINLEKNFFISIYVGMISLIRCVNKFAICFRILKQYFYLTNRI